MEEEDVRARAEALCAALVAGDVDGAIADLSTELRGNLGEVIALLPLPASAATVATIERGGNSGFTVVLDLVGATETVELQTRWKDRDDHPTIIEVSHLSRVEATPPDAEGDDEAAETSL